MLKTATETTVNARASRAQCLGSPTADKTTLWKQATAALSRHAWKWDGYAMQRCDTDGTRPAYMQRQVAQVGGVEGGGGVARGGG